MATIYILEDDPNRMIRFNRELIGNTVIHEWDADNFIKQLKTAGEEKIDIMFLDHDLGGEQFVDSANDNTGMGVVRWMEKNKVNVDLIVVHSLNRPAANEMANKLENAGYNNVLVIPFIYLDSQEFEHILKHAKTI